MATPPTTDDPRDRRLADTLPDTTVPSGPVPPREHMAAQGHARYQFGALLGHGSSAQVYEARDLVFDRQVAVKVLADPGGGAVARFIREARITALLDHPNVVTVHDLDFDERGHSFMVMKRVAGISLGEALRAANQGDQVDAIASVNAVLGIILKVCDALSRAHARGIHHRDVKPDNILLGSDGEVMLVDWGEASVSGEDSGTRRGTPIGTPLYMSPEQARGEGGSPASDIYGLGATLFHALIGRPPQRPDDPDAFLRRRAIGDIDAPDRQERARVPAPLLAIVTKALAADAGERYRSIAALRDDLLHFQAGLAVSAFRDSALARLRRWARRHRSAIVTAGLMLGALSATTWFVVGERLKEYTTWGAPSFIEHFPEDGIPAHWKTVEGDFTVRDGALVSTGASRSQIELQKTLTVPVAVEYEACVLPGSKPCDLSLQWIEQIEGAPSKSMLQLWIQYGANDNRDCRMVIRSGSWFVADSSAHRLEPGRTHLMRVEFDGEVITAWLDRRPILRYRPPIPLGSGRISLVAWYPDKAFRTVRIFQRTMPEKTGVLSLGDTIFRLGRTDDAALVYGQIAGSHRGTPLGEQARYRQGLALMGAGRQQEAERIWQDLTDHTLRHAAACQFLPDLLARNDFTTFLARFRSLWDAADTSRDILQQQWLAAADRAKSTWSDDHDAICRQLLDLFDHCRFSNPVCAWTAGHLLIRLDRADEALRRFGQYPVPRFEALLDLGQSRQVLDDPMANEQERGHALWQLGRLGDIPAQTGTNPNFFACVRAKGGMRDGDSLVDLLLAGRADEALRLPACQKVPFRQFAYLQLGRLREAARYRPPNGTMTWLTVQACDLADEPLPPAASQGRAAGLVRQLLWLRACAASAQPPPADLPVLEQGIIHAVLDRDMVAGQGWFVPWFAVPFTRLLAGDRTGFDQAMRTVVERHAEQFGQRPLFLARLIAGTVERTAFLAQPIVTEADAWLQVGLGMRAERLGDADAARTAYRAFKELPWHRRLLIGLIPDASVERFVAWRLQALEGKP